MTEKSTNKRETGGKPFSGKLRPHAALILELRKTMTWQQVAEALKEKVKIETTAAYVCEFVGRYQKRPAPRGREFEAATAPAPQQPAPATPASTEGRKDPVSPEQRQRIEKLKSGKAEGTKTPEADPWASLTDFKSSQPLTLETKTQQPKQ